MILSELVLAIRGDNSGLTRELEKSAQQVNDFQRKVAGAQPLPVASGGGLGAQAEAATASIKKLSDAASVLQKLLQSNGQYASAATAAMKMLGFSEQAIADAADEVSGGFNKQRQALQELIATQEKATATADLLLATQRGFTGQAPQQLGPATPAVLEATLSRLAGSQQLGPGSDGGAAIVRTLQKEQNALLALAAAEEAATRAGNQFLAQQRGLTGAAPVQLGPATPGVLQSSLNRLAGPAQLGPRLPSGNLSIAQDQEEALALNATLEKVGTTSQNVSARGISAFTGLSAAILLSDGSARGVALGLSTLGVGLARSEVAAGNLSASMGQLAIGGAALIGVFALIYDASVKANQALALTQTFTDHITNLSATGTASAIKDVDDRIKSLNAELGKETTLGNLKKVLEASDVLTNARSSDVAREIAKRTVFTGGSVSAQLADAEAQKSALVKAGADKTLAETRANLENRIAAANQAAQNEVSIVQARNQRIQALNDANLTLGLTTLNKSFDDRLNAIHTGARAEIAAIETQQKGLLTPRPGPQDLPEALARRTEAQQLGQQIVAINQRTEAQTIALDAQRLVASEAVDRSILASRLGVFQATGNTSAALSAQLTQIAQQASDFARELSKTNLAPGQQDRAVRDFQQGLSASARSQAALTEAGQAFNQVQQDTARIQDRISAGFTRQADGARHIAAVQRAALPGLLAQVVAVEKLARNSITQLTPNGNTALIQQAQALRAEYERLGLVLDDDTLKFLKMADAASGLLSAARDLVGALGGAGSQLDRVLQGAQTINKGAENIAVGVATADPIKVIQGAVSVVSGAISLGQALFGESAEHKRLIQESNAAHAKNTEALQAATLAFSGFNAKSGSAIANAQKALDPGTIAAISQIVGLGSLINRPDLAELEILTASLKKVGLTFEQLDAIAKANNITLRDSRNNIIPQSLRDLQKALEQAAKEALSFGGSLSEQRKKIDIGNAVRGTVDSPAQSVKDNIALLNKFAPALAGSLNGISATTTEGRDKLRAGIVSLLDQFEKGTLSLNDLGGLSRDEFLQLLADVGKSLTSLGDTASSVAEKLINVPTGFKVALARFTAQDAISPINRIRPPTFDPSSPFPGDGGGSAVPLPPRPGVPGRPLTPGGGDTHFHFDKDAITIQGSDKTAKELFRDVALAAQDLASTQLGNSTRAGDAFAIVSR